jgi:sugar lactone lactonase YvrE
MSTNNCDARARAIRLFLLTLVLIAVLQFVGFLVLGLRHTHRDRLPQKTIAGARSIASQERGVRPGSNGHSSSHPGAERQAAQTVVKYGRAEGELGMVHEQGRPPVGPEAFAVDSDGGILVADVVNQRVVAYARDGSYLRSISVPGVALGDVAADRQGRLYVYDQARRTLRLHDADGTPRNLLGLNPKDIDTRGYFHVTGNAVYFADAAARDVLVATVQDGVLVPADDSAARVTDGVHGESGRVYSMSLDKGQGLRLQVRDPAQASPQVLEVPMGGIVSARFAGEDDARRFYVQTERLEGKKVVLEVLAFGPTGEKLSTTRMPENDYFIWTSKLVDVRGDGTIVQFLPERDQAKLNLFTN